MSILQPHFIVTLLRYVSVELKELLTYLLYLQHKERETRLSQSNLEECVALAQLCNKVPIHE